MRAPSTRSPTSAMWAAAHGYIAPSSLAEPTSDDAEDLDAQALRETDVIGKAAGVEVADGTALGGPDEIERRDAHRWELDPASADEVVPIEDPADKPRAKHA